MRGKKRALKTGTEHQLQVAVIKYLRLKYPDALHCATVGGVRLTIIQAARMKQAGYLRGVPDLLIFEARGGFFGLSIEIKTLTGYPSKYQKEVINQLIKRGYRAEVRKGWDEITALIDEYFALPKT